MKKLREYLNQIYRISISHKKQEKLVWEDLKSLHAKEKWESGIYENEKLIETRFNIAKERVSTFYYSIYERQFLCRVEVLDFFHSDLTTDVFILASHFNNIMKYGKVIVNVQSQAVQYHIKNSIFSYLLYPGDIHFQLKNHYDIAKDLRWAFQQLLDTDEPPAIIIADFLKKKEDEESKNDLK